MIGPPRSSRPPPIEPYGWRPDADACKKKAINDIKDAWRAWKSGALPHDMCRKLIREKLLWNLTGFEGLAKGSISSNTDFRFMTEAAYDLCDPADKNLYDGLRHDHVYPRAQMATKVLDCETEEDVEKTIAPAVACIVTVDDHNKLAAYEHLYGWERYEKAGLKVIERQPTERPGRRRRR